jgi:hypothetical protein
MMQRIVYRITRRDDMWAMRCMAESMGSFMSRERAIRFACLLAQRNYQSNGRPAVVRLYDGDDPVDILLLGEKDPAANALAWIRRVSALRKLHEDEQGSVGTSSRVA